MATEIRVPSFGESVTSGIVGAWVKKEGDFVESGDTLLEIETDKVTAEIPAPSAGVLHLTAKEGDQVNVGQVIGTIDETAPRPAAKREAAPAKQAPEKAAVATVAAKPPAKAEPTSAPPQAKAPAGASAAPAADGRGSEPLPLPPSLRRMVREGKISGDAGRIPAAALEKLGAPSLGERTTRRPMSTIRRKIAERLLSAQAGAAMLTTFNEVDMSAVMALRKRYQDRFTQKHGIKLGVMSFFVRAAVEALRAIPQINARIDGAEIVENHFYDIGVAMSTDRGLMVPVLRDADRMSLAEIERAIAEFATKARAGKIALTDLEGGVFTITNGGVFGSMLSTPILNPPQSGILGMHAITDRPVAVDGRVEIRPMMYLALTYDHRLVDGREAVTFLVRVKEFIEQPGSALLGL
ncbi:MAG TPA: 2-oxoglutarate dehydrogenase complex dihydrolipoyllysine-residue succinyltransferase [Verrucomicrobiae bacterium]|nr:2-oxoglutarate dehydrogenase complex dihydrolipoyllysine-residue succinyltransferase [Verrucomicrobiae bacterium]